MHMEEHVHESCRVVYFCSSAQKDVHELYHRNRPPTAASDAQTSVDHTYRNIRALLDEDQGGFSEGEKIIFCAYLALSGNTDIA